MSCISERGRRVYEGPPLEQGGTDPKVKTPSPALRRLVRDGRIVGRVLDYGAGKLGRNAIYLRSLGHEVYAYDPYLGTDACGWQAVSRHLPTGHFDTGLTSFVLNVVPLSVEIEICRRLDQYAETSFHVTRNLDVVLMIEKALRDPNSVVTQFFLKHANRVQRILYERGKLELWDIEEFARFGTATSRGFQRVPVMEDRGWVLLHETTGWKLYSRSNRRLES